MIINKSVSLTLKTVIQYLTNYSLSQNCKFLSFILLFECSITNTLLSRFHEGYGGVFEMAPQMGPVLRGLESATLKCGDQNYGLLQSSSWACAYTTNVARSKLKGRVL